MKEDNWIASVLNFLRLTHEQEENAIIHESIEKAVIFRGTNLWILVFAILIAPSVLVGIYKIVSRIMKPELRYISTFDDYFSLISLESFLFFGVMVLLYDTPFWRSWYFLITAFFLFYVPFSKISHYIYFFFAHILTGWRYGWRGIIPQKQHDHE